MIDKLSILNDNLTDDLKSCLDENNTLKERYVRRIISSIFTCKVTYNNLLLYMHIYIGVITLLMR